LADADRGIAVSKGAVQPSAEKTRELG
jgi:hypothetical protein